MVVCGTEAEATIVSRVMEHARLEEGVNLAGKTTLSQFIELVRGARLLIGNETSAVHIAAAVGTPSICLLGGGHFGRFLPYPDCVEGAKPVAVYERMECYGCNWRCHQPHPKGGAVPCISTIDVETVMKAVEKSIKKIRA